GDPGRRRRLCDEGRSCHTDSVEPLALGALDRRAEPLQALVDPLVATVDLADVADRRASLCAEGGDQHRHAGTDVGALEALAVQPGGTGDDDSVWVAED